MLVAVRAAAPALTEWDVLVDANLLPVANLRRLFVIAFEEGGWWWGGGERERVCVHVCVRVRVRVSPRMDDSVGACACRGK